jgi:hypothetical protein
MIKIQEEGQFLLYECPKCKIKTWISRSFDDMCDNCCEYAPNPFKLLEDPKFKIVFHQGLDEYEAFDDSPDLSLLVLQSMSENWQ